MIHVFSAGVIAGLVLGYTFGTIQTIKLADKKKTKNLSKPETQIDKLEQQTQKLKDDIEGTGLVLVQAEKDLANLMKVVAELCNYVYRE
jgi:uncharacterized membrane-anchored protein YhcB (DUF1043 family)